MPPIEFNQLSRRERQIMEVLYELKEGSAQEVLDRVPDPPSYSSIRALIARLVKKELVEFRYEGTKHIYSPKISDKKAQKSALSRLVSTFFKGRKVNAINALLDNSADELTSIEIDMLENKIKQIKKQKD